MKPPIDPEPSLCYFGLSFLIYQMVMITFILSTSQSCELGKNLCASILLTAKLMSHNDSILAFLASVCLSVK